MNGEKRIQKIFAVIYNDTDGTEGVPAVAGPEGEPLPLYCTSEKNLTAFGRIIFEMAKKNGRPCTLAEFSVRRDLKRVDAQGYELPVLAHEDQHLMLLALAVMATMRPGFDHALGLVANQIGEPGIGAALFEEYKKYNEPPRYYGTRPVGVEEMR